MMHMKFLMACLAFTCLWRKGKRCVLYRVVQLILHNKLKLSI